MRSINAKVMRTGWCEGYGGSVGTSIRRGNLLLNTISHHSIFVRLLLSEIQEEESLLNDNFLVYFVLALWIDLS